MTSLTHHATLFVTNDRKKYTSHLWNELRRESVAHILHDHTVFDIDTARTLISWANTPYEGEKIALISFHTITIPAQNALLKILEEPRAGVRFVLVTSHRDALLPTLYSRLQERQGDVVEYQENDLARLFLETSCTQRMKLPGILALLSATDEENRKDREQVKDFILSLVSILPKNENSHKNTLIGLEMASYAADPSASGKALLEYLSLLLPQTK